MEVVPGDQEHAPVKHQRVGIALVLEMRGRREIAVDVAGVPEQRERPFDKTVRAGERVFRAARLMGPVICSLGSIQAADKHSVTVLLQGVSRALGELFFEQGALPVIGAQFEATRERTQCVQDGGQHCFH